jgi:hypothetical protein
LVWVLVKLSNSDLPITCRIYQLIGALPRLAKKDNYSENEIQKTMLYFFSLYSQKANETRMFYDLLSLLSSTTSVELRVAIMHLINQIIDMYTQLEPRISMRLQFSSFNIEDIMSNIYDKGSTQLKQEIDTFTNSNLDDTKNYLKYMKV